VADLVEDLGPALVVGTTGDLSGQISTVSVSDPLHPTPLAEETLVVAVGFSVTDCARLQQLAAEAGSPAVLARCRASARVGLLLS
jgi:hypothetical protein